jgi:hypothetical protein
MIQCLNTDARGAIIANWPVGIQAGGSFPQKSSPEFCKEGAEKLPILIVLHLRHLRASFSCGRRLVAAIDALSSRFYSPPPAHTCAAAIASVISTPCAGSTSP